MKLKMQSVCLKSVKAVKRASRSTTQTIDFISAGNLLIYIGKFFVFSFTPEAALSCQY